MFVIGPSKALKGPFVVLHCLLDDQTGTGRVDGRRFVRDGVRRAVFDPYIPFKAHQA